MQIDDVKLKWCSDIWSPAYTEYNTALYIKCKLLLYSPTANGFIYWLNANSMQINIFVQLKNPQPPTIPFKNLGYFSFWMFLKIYYSHQVCIYSSKHTLKRYFCELLQFKATVCGFVYSAISGKWVEFTVINIPQWIAVHMHLLLL